MWVLVCVSVPRAPPTNLVVYNETTTTLNARWTAPTGRVTNYRVTYVPVAGGRTQTVSPDTITYSLPGMFKKWGWRVALKTAGMAMIWLQNNEPLLKISIMWFIKFQTSFILSYNSRFCRFLAPLPKVNVCYNFPKQDLKKRDTTLQIHGCRNEKWRKLSLQPNVLPSFD